MIVKLRVPFFFVLLFTAVLLFQACSPSRVVETEAVLSSSTPGEIPLWTPRPFDKTQTAIPTVTKPAPISAAIITSQSTVTETPQAIATPKVVTVSMVGGNLFVRRGPSLDYNYVGVLYNGDSVVATGRDRISRWIRIALPSRPDVEGWITTETQYTQIEGDISNLPFVETEPARPAFIRNCTFHELLVRPVGIQLLARDDEPYNEERFSVGIYQVYDLENPENKPIKEVDLSEGEAVDIQYDWTGEKSKCE